MTDNLRDRIAAVIAAHEPVTDYNGADGECVECDLNPRWPDSEAPTGPTAGWNQHATHLADAVIRELGPLVRYWDKDFKELHYCRECGGWGPDK